MKTTIMGIIRPQELKPFLKTADSLNAFILLFLYLSSAAVIYFYNQFASLWYFILSYFVMGAFQHTIVTYIHEASHGHLFSKKNWNDNLGHLLCSAPFFTFLKEYRYFHLEHHRYTGNLEKDPELLMYRSLGLKTSYVSKWQVAKVFMNDVIGVNYVKSLAYLVKFIDGKKKKGAIPHPNLFEILCMILWVVLIPVLMWQLGFLKAYILLWIIPMLTITPTMLRWHAFGEHIREKESCLSDNTLTHNLGPISTLFLYPIHSGYHLEHHLYPQIPWHQMKKFYLWAHQNPNYSELARKLTVTSLFFGPQSIVKTTFFTTQKN